jgi:hypothetical protein
MQAKLEQTMENLKNKTCLKSPTRNSYNSWDDPPSIDAKSGFFSRGAHAHRDSLVLYRFPRIPLGRDHRNKLLVFLPRKNQGNSDHAVTSIKVTIWLFNIAMKPWPIYRWFIYKNMVIFHGLS